MVRALITNAAFAAWAYQQAGICADLSKHGLAVGVLALFFCMLGNQLVASWWRS